MINFPRGNGQDEPLATSRWMDTQTVMDALAHESEMINPVPIGQLHNDKGMKVPLSYDDEGHMLVTAGTRGGKGVSFIIPTLLSYLGSMVVIDPKAENFFVTADLRQNTLKQKIIRLDPFMVTGERGGYFNPLDMIDPEAMEAIDDVTDLAEALVIRSSGKDAHWDDSARSIINGVLLYILATHPAGDRSMKYLRTYVTQGLDLGDGDICRDNLLFAMKSCTAFDGVVSGIAERILNMGETESGGVFSTVERHTEFMDSASMKHIFEHSDFDPAELRNQEQGVTLYLILPEYRMDSHARWLRLMLTIILIALQKNKRVGKTQPSVLMMLDEFPALGSMKIIERSAGYIAGFGVKLAFIIQDLAQLKDLYPKRWETILGNSSLLIAFANTDMTSLEYLSKRLGKTELHQIEQGLSQNVSSSDTRAGLGKLLDFQSEGAGLGAESVGRSDSTTMTHNPKRMISPLLHPDEIARIFGRETGKALILIAGALPIWVEKICYYNDPFYQEKAMDNPYQRG